MKEDFTIRQFCVFLTRAAIVIFFFLWTVMYYIENWSNFSGVVFMLHLQVRIYSDVQIFSTNICNIRLWSFEHAVNFCIWSGPPKPVQRAEQQCTVIIASKLFYWEPQLLVKVKIATDSWHHDIFSRRTTFKRKLNQLEQLFTPRNYKNRECSTYLQNFFWHFCNFWGINIPILVSYVRLLIRQIIISEVRRDEKKMACKKLFCLFCKHEDGQFLGVKVWT